jgi:hypothetical protein
VANIIFHPEAQVEYERALTWYQARSSSAADRESQSGSSGFAGSLG